MTFLTTDRERERDKVKSMSVSLSRLNVKYEATRGEVAKYISDIDKLNRLLKESAIREDSIQRSFSSATQSQQDAWRNLQEEKERNINLMSNNKLLKEREEKLVKEIAQYKIDYENSQAANEAWREAYEGLERDWRMRIEEVEKEWSDRVENIEVEWRKSILEVDLKEKELLNTIEEQRRIISSGSQLYNYKTFEGNNEEWKVNNEEEEQDLLLLNEIKSENDDDIDNNYNPPPPLEEVNNIVNNKNVNWSENITAYEEESTLAYPNNDAWERLTTETGFVYYYNHANGEYWSEGGEMNSSEGNNNNSNEHVASGVDKYINEESPTSPAFRSSKTSNYFKSFRASHNTDINFNGVGNSKLNSIEEVYSPPAYSPKYDEENNIMMENRFENNYYYNGEFVVTGEGVGGEDDGLLTTRAWDESAVVNEEGVGIVEDGGLGLGLLTTRDWDDENLAPGAYSASNTMEGEGVEENEKPTSPERVVKVWERFFDNAFKISMERERKMTEEMQILKDSFFITLTEGEYEEITDFLDNGVDVNIKDELGNSPLHYASRRGMISLMSRLIDSGCDVDAVNEDGDTPLHECSSFTSEEGGKCLRFLLESMASVTIQNLQGNVILCVMKKNDCIYIYIYYSPFNF